MSAQDKALFHQRLAELDLTFRTAWPPRCACSPAAVRQALTLLMAILKTPKLLLLDEHTAALDPKTARKVLELSDHFISSMADSPSWSPTTCATPFSMATA